MKFSKWPYWVKGGIIGLFLGTLHFIVITICLFNWFHLLSPRSWGFECVVWPAVFGPHIIITGLLFYMLRIEESPTTTIIFVIISLIVAFGLGALIGHLISKFKGGYMWNIYKKALK